MSRGRRPEDLVDRAHRWLDEGNIERAARLIAKAGDTDHPEVLVLRGRIAALQGDSPAAVALYGAAHARDPEWAEPILLLAEAGLVDDPQIALEWVRALTDHDDLAVRADALLLSAEAHCAMQEKERAIERLRALAELKDPLPEVALDAAGLAFELEEDRLAERWYRRVLELDPASGDALHGLGLVHRERSQLEAMAEAWLRVREIDLARARPEWSLHVDELERITESALRELGPEVYPRLRDVPIFVEDAPSEAQIRDGIDPRLLGLFTGTPLPHKGQLDGASQGPDSIYVFVRNLENASASREELEAEVRITVLHETAHFFGLEDEDLEELGLG